MSDYDRLLEMDPARTDPALNAARAAAWMAFCKGLAVMGNTDAGEHKHVFQSWWLSYGVNDARSTLVGVRDEIAVLTTALELRDQEVGWLDKELEHATEGRRVKQRGTASERAFLAENRALTSINMNAYTQALDAIDAATERAENAETLLAAPEAHWECQQKIDALEVEVARLTKAVNL